jgi:hypothetical protein
MIDGTSSDDFTLGLMKYGVLARRYFLGAYWLLFVGLAVDWGQYPGYVPNPELQPYPWKAVALSCAFLAVAVAVLYAILRPVTFHRSWGRLGFALLYAAVLFVVGAATFVTDQPGYYYVPAYFSAATLLGLIVFAVFLGASTLWQRTRHEP